MGLVDPSVLVPPILCPLRIYDDYPGTYTLGQTLQQSMLVRQHDERARPKVWSLVEVGRRIHALPKFPCPWLVHPPHPIAKVMNDLDVRVERWVEEGVSLVLVDWRVTNISPWSQNEEGIEEDDLSQLPPDLDERI